jgi:hypothetical protein
VSQNGPLTEETILVSAVQEENTAPRAIQTDQAICYLSKSEGVLVTGSFAGYVKTVNGQLGVLIRVAGKDDRRVPLSRLINPDYKASHLDGTPLLFTLRVPPSSKSGEAYRIATLKRIWAPATADPSDMSALWLSVEVADFSTTLTGHLNDGTREEQYDMPTILRFNVSN